MRHKYLREGEGENSVVSSKKYNRGGKGSRLRLSIDSLANDPSRVSILIVLNLIGSKSGYHDRCIISSFRFSMEALTSMMASSEGKSVSRKSCELGESTNHMDKVG
jgi:hypothetical protein